jgi:hypothetical protein
MMSMMSEAPDFALTRCAVEWLGTAQPRASTLRFGPPVSPFRFLGSSIRTTSTFDWSTQKGVTPAQWKA